ncbi:MAG: carboxylesterase family protein [Crocinitomicaceae bacterium]|nr:carboxylesterase family protein [Crocinitomicaceae bacterium]
MKLIQSFLLLAYALTSIQLSASEQYDVVLSENIIYGKNKTQGGFEEILKLDLYLPDKAEKSKLPLIILAHGGYFLAGNKKDLELECIGLASNGFAVASINYRLIDVEESEMSYKRAVVDAVFDMKAAVRFFRKEIAANNSWSLDADNIFIGGYSAGAITSLHYAYTSAPQDIYDMGGNLMLNYILRHGGKEGDSGNPGYSSAVSGVINIAGSLHSAQLVDANEPPLFSIHGTADNIVPFETGISGESNVETEGSGLIHKRAELVGLKNKLIAVVGEDHFLFYERPEFYLQEITAFVKDNQK